MLLASVVDSRSRPLVTVGADDFVITEGSQSREVLDVHVADYPVVILLDDGVDGASQQVLPAITRAAARFISRIGQRPVAVGTLSLADRFVATFEDDRAEVLSRVEQLAATSAPAVPLEAISYAARIVADTGAPFSAIVILTSRALGFVESTATERLPAVLDSGATVHVIAARLSPADDRAPDAPDLLRGLAEQTHGQYTGIFTTASYAIALDRLADRMATEMMIEYLVPPGPAAGDVRVGARIPGARVLGLGVSK
ncbi:MAG: hypothetical protein GEU82_14490 [Luteitalea sp.]|nr:hypothetical protein [Luteitalea sp.]